MKSKAQKECDVRLKEMDRLLRPLLKRIDPFWSIKQRIARLERKLGLMQ